MTSEGWISSRSPVTVLLVVAAGSLVAGCAPIDLTTMLGQRAPHKVEGFTLQNRFGNGGLSLSLNSPRARHDWIRRTSVVTTPEALIHRDGVPVYRIRAQRGLLLGSNRLVQLDGTVELAHLQEPPTVATGERLRWDTRRGRMTMTVNLTVARQDVEVTAERGELDFAGNDLVFHDQVVLLDRSPQAGDLRLEATTLHWNLASGEMMAPGLVKGWQNDPAGAVQFVQGVDLTGSSQRRWLALQAPVRLQTRRAGQWRAYGPVLWWLDRQQLESPALLEAQMEDLRISGRSAALNLEQDVLTIAEDCRFRQPGEALNAQQCRWDLQEGLIVASGDVSLEREQYRQVTRADQLQGRLGEDNVLRLTAPSQGQVTTEFVLREPETAGDGAGI
ncbi:MAG: LPS export ABC transporter periplasmic protein LptC [Cyanobacteria bacterium MAG CAR3_bin_5]|nr:LPS export ABC transporter periplasmic protein LptC [Cyanobacteria bacterium MAG CAR3_bin_5]